MYFSSLSHLTVLATLHDKVTCAFDTASFEFCELSVLTVECGDEFGLKCDSIRMCKKIAL